MAGPRIGAALTRRRGVHGGMRAMRSRRGERSVITWWACFRCSRSIRRSRPFQRIATLPAWGPLRELDVETRRDAAPREAAPRRARDETLLVVLVPTADLDPQVLAPNPSVVRRAEAQAHRGPREMRDLEVTLRQRRGARELLPAALAELHRRGNGRVPVGFDRDAELEPDGEPGEHAQIDPGDHEETRRQPGPTSVRRRDGQARR